MPQALADHTLTNSKVQEGIKMRALTKLIREDMKPALGVTEPSAIAFSAAKARSYTTGPIRKIKTTLNSGMYKNAFTCGIPNSDLVGNAFAAALGAIAGRWEKGLEVLADVTPEDNAAARQLVAEQKVAVSLSDISSEIFIETTVETDCGSCTVTIRDTHTNIVRITVDGKSIFEVNTQKERSGSETEGRDVSVIHRYRLEDILTYVETVPEDEITFLQDAYDINWALFERGLNSARTTFAPCLLNMNGGKIFSDDEEKTAQLLCNTAIEARVIGLDKPAMSITGSGAHGIIATMPLYAVYRVRGLPKEKLLRATALSYLVCMYIKEYSGRLSAFCGCAIAAGTGMACALTYLSGGGLEEMTHTINNMASSITGMICDGGNQGCTMKGIVAVGAAFKSVRFAMNGVGVASAHGINGRIPEETMRQMGLIASPGMVGTERTILEILEHKSSAQGDG